MVHMHSNTAVISKQIARFFIRNQPLFLCLQVALQIVINFFLFLILFLNRLFKFF